MDFLKKWKDDNDRKPLIIRGARQVGKTWLMKYFGKEFYKNTVYINFDNNALMKDLFRKNFRIDRIITGMELYSGVKIDSDNTLIIFDEIQEVPEALSSLKYFNENASEYHIICAGSLLGVALHRGTSFPVGKVEFLDLYPLSFPEFMRALGKDDFVELLEKGDFDMANTFREEYILLLRYYYYVGGMPEVVENFRKNKDFTKVRKIQERILLSYEQDFSKHAPGDVIPKIRMILESIPSQLSKENKKFIYGQIREGSRAKEYETALLWLKDCGVIHKIHRINNPSIPLKAYEDIKAFKIYLLDVGLLSCMVRLDQSVLIEGNVLFKNFKGALTEQYVLQQLKTLNNLDIFYWTNNNGNAELDFLIDSRKNIIPLEVKAEVNLKAKSLKAYYEKFKPEISIRTAMTEFRKEEWLVNLPLWAINQIEKVFDQ